MPEKRKNKILIFNGRFTSAFVLILTVLLICLTVSFAGSTVAYFTSKLASITDAARVAEWKVNVSIADTPVAMRYNSGWSTPYKVEIINNSEVLASYGHDTDGNLDASYSYLTFSNLPVAVNRVRIFDAQNGEISDLSTSLQNNSIVVRFAGVLNPGETKVYYIQFCSNTVQESSAVAYENVVVVNAQFTFEQAFREYLTLAVGATPNTGSFALGSSAVATQLDQNGVNSNAVDTSKISGVNSNSVDTSKMSGTNSNAIDTSKTYGVNSSDVDTSKVSGVDSKAVDSSKLSGVKSDAVDTSKMDAVNSDSVSNSFIVKK